MPATTRVLSGPELWPEISTLSKESKPGARKAAVAYVTSDRYVALRNGDLLVVDASEDAVRAKSTSPKTLRAAVKAGAKVYSVEGLHAKVYIFGKVAVVGSANASERSAGPGRVEAAVRTDDPVAVGEAVAFVDGLTKDRKPLDVFALDRLASLLKAGEDEGEVTQPILSVHGLVALFKQPTGKDDQGVVRPKKPFMDAIRSALTAEGINVGSFRFEVRWRGERMGRQTFDVPGGYSVITINKGPLASAIVKEWKAVKSVDKDARVHRTAELQLFDDGSAVLEVASDAE